MLTAVATDIAVRGQIGGNGATDVRPNLVVCVRKYTSARYEIGQAHESSS